MILCLFDCICVRMWVCINVCFCKKKSCVCMLLCLGLRCHRLFQYIQYMCSCIYIYIYIYIYNICEQCEVLFSLDINLNEYLIKEEVVLPTNIVIIGIFLV